MKVTVKVCVYLRCSSDQQELSIERQRKEVLEFCKAKGYQVVAIYIDEGISASKDFKRRIDFMRMMREAPKAEWGRIVCYNTGRFGRTDSQKGAWVKVDLRAACKVLETVVDGVIDWESSTGRIMDSVRSEMDHDYAVNIGRHTSSGRDNVLDLGYWPFGEVPYGYDRQYEYQGNVVATIGRQDTVIGVKARDWRLRLIINQDETAIVRWVFKQFLSGACRGMRALARLLNDKGVKSPGGKLWGKDSIKAMLTNRAYVGQTGPGLVRARKKDAFNRMKDKVKDGVAPIIIDPADWQKAQGLVTKQSAFRPARENYKNGCLSGIVYCGHCGYAMEKRGRIYKNGQPYVSYACSSGNKRPGLCRQYTIQEAKILPFVCRKLIESVDHELLAALAAKPDQQPKADLMGQKKQAETLRKQIAKGVERLIVVDDDSLADLQQKIKALRAELAQLEQAIALAEGPKQEEVEQWRSWWMAARGRLVLLADIQWGKAEVLREPILIPSDQRKALRKSLDAKGQVRVEGKTLELDQQGQWWLLREVESVTHPALSLEPLALRSLLHDMGCRVSLFWKMGKRYATLEKAHLQASFGEQVLAHDDATSRQNLLRIDRVCKFQEAA